MRRVPEVMGALAGRLANALELAGGLLGAVALQPNAVLPLLRAACQALAVDGGLDALQVKCIGAGRLNWLPRSHLLPGCRCDMALGCLQDTKYMPTTRKRSNTKYLGV